MIKSWDSLQILFWSLTYILAIISAFKSKDKKSAIPLISIALNFAWETNSVIIRLATSSRLFSVPFIGNLIWWILDAMIVILALRSTKTKTRLFVVIFWVIICVFLYFTFKLTSGMLISSFIIDLIMAANFLLDHSRLSNRGQRVIAVSKLLGDMFAWIAYKQEMLLINLIGIAVLTLNLIYLVVLLWDTPIMIRISGRTNPT